MARSMTHSEIDKWLAEGTKPGLADVEAKFIDLDNPDFQRPGAPTRASQTKEVQQITYTRNDGKKLTVLDKGEKNVQPGEISGPDPGTPGGLNPGRREEPKYEVVGEGKPPTPEPTDNRSPEAKRNDQRVDAEREANLQDPNNRRWETDDQKADRIRTERLDSQAAEDRHQKELTATAEAQNRAKQLDIQDRSATRQDATAEGNLEVSRGQLTIAQQNAARAAAKDERDANKPEFLSRADDTNARIAYFDPKSGEVKSAENPNYDAIKVEAARKREDLSLQIQLGKLKADEAAAEYNRWFKENVEVPFMQSAEARAQAAEKRAALQAEEQRKQFAATEARQRRAMGLEAGQAAVKAEIDTLPYRVGPAFAGQFSSAVNSLAAGGNMNNNASAGINFTPDAFEFDKPDFQGISAEATKNALKGLTNYSPAAGNFATADYAGINFPTTSTMPSAPAAAPKVDYQSMMNSIPYKPAQ